MKNKLKYIYIRFFLFPFAKKSLRGEILQELLTDEELLALSFTKKGYLKEIGWWNSLREKAPLDQNNKPIPWITYSFISFIRPRLNNTMTIFEFGSGNSTLFYSEIVKKVYAVENNEDWYKMINANLPSNVSLIYQNTENDEGLKYTETVSSVNLKFDIIIIDGRERVKCMSTSLENIKSNGVIILDDSERAKYQKGIEIFKNQGFKQLDFWGISPGFFAYNKCTSIFYKDENLFNI